MITFEQKLQIYDKIITQPSNYQSIVERSISACLEGEPIEIEQNNNNSELDQKYIEQLQQEEKEKMEREAELNKQAIEAIKKEEEEQLKQLRQMERENEMQSISIINKIQQDEEQKLDEIRRVKEEIDYENAVCNICLVELALDKELAPWGLKNCGHVFHENCLEDYCKIQIESRKFPILCPEDKCKMEINQEDLLQICDDDLIEKFRNYSFQAFCELHQDDMSYCPTPDCKYIFIFDPLLEQKDFTCPVCQKRYCLDCRVEYHYNETCEEYKTRIKWANNDNEIFAFVQGMKFKQCPKCKFWIEKNQGCNHMTCRCGYQMCYKCGKKYGGGKGECYGGCPDQQENAPIYHPPPQNHLPPINQQQIRQPQYIGFGSQSKKRKQKQGKKKR